MLEISYVIILMYLLCLSGGDWQCGVCCRQTGAVSRQRHTVVSWLCQRALLVIFLATPEARDNSKTPCTGTLAASTWFSTPQEEENAPSHNKETRVETRDKRYEQETRPIAGKAKGSWICLM